MKAKEYFLLERCIEDGIQRGINRAHKYLDDNQLPTREHLQRYIQESVMLEICEWFDFEKVDNHE